MKLAILKRASAEEKQAWSDNPKEIYPLWGWVLLRHGTRCAVEDLRGHWSAPDPVWEVHAPDGYHFGSGEGTHSLLCYSQNDVRDRLSYATLIRCGEECSGWIGEEVVSNPATINDKDLET